MKLMTIINYDLFSMLGTQGIYAWKRGDEYLYIGCSGNLLRRLSYHNIIDRVEKFLPGDILELYTHNDGGDFLKLLAEEDRLIDKYRPKYSTPVFKDGMSTEKKTVICPMCKKEFMQKRYWQKFCSKQCGGGRPQR